MTDAQATEIAPSYAGILDLLEDTSQFAACIRSAHGSRPDLFALDERSLWRTMGREKCQPSPTDNRLRLSFWEEYNRAKMKSERMKITRITDGICSSQFFLDHYIVRPEKVAWMLCIPASYEVTMKEALAFSICKMRDILDIPVVDEKTGKINSSMANLQFRISQKLHEMVHGATVQRSINVNIGEKAAGDKAIQDALMSNNMEDIQKKLAQLEKRDRMKALDVVVEQVVETKPTEALNMDAVVVNDS
jgi:3-dehydroquinate dehydratase